MGLVLDVLRTVEFLASGPPELAPQFLDLGRTHEFPRHHTFWNAGQSPQGIVIPITGEVAAISTDSGGRQLCYAFFGPGECAGAPCVLDDLPQASDLRAIREGEYFVMDCAPFRRFLDGRPAVRSSVLATVGRLFRRSLAERDRVVFLPAGARLARFLIERACVRRTDGARLLLRETHAEIAICLGTVREVVARAMAEFAERGLIRRTRHALFIVDWAGLCEEAGCADGKTPECCGDTALAGLRTTRFVLPVLERGAHQVADEAGVCHEHLADLGPCIARKCTLAIAAGPVAGRTHVRTPAVRSSSFGRPAFETPSAVSLRDAGTERPASADDPRTATGPIAKEPRAHGVDDGYVRSPDERRSIERRIGLYRTRVAAIEASRGADDPGSASLFRPPPAVTS